MKRIIQYFVLLVLVSLGFTFCVKDDLSEVPEELGTSLNIVFPTPPSPPPPLPPPVYGTETDQDGNTFKTVKIGDQIWMAENLRTTKYNDGTPIPFISSWNVWDDRVTGAYCWYDNNSPHDYGSIYGAFYNGFAVITGKLCPTGWHVPELPEWATLVTYLGGRDVAGGKMKEAGTSHWKLPNTGATNQSGFKALPGGTHKPWYWYTDNIICFSDEPDHSIGVYSEWWSATPDTSEIYEYWSTTGAALAVLGLFNTYEKVFGLDSGSGFPDNLKIKNGSYVRCIKDN